jgi:hypothetical protein
VVDSAWLPTDEAQVDDHATPSSALARVYGDFPFAFPDTGFLLRTAKHHIAGGAGCFGCGGSGAYRARCSRRHENRRASASERGWQLGRSASLQTDVVMTVYPVLPLTVMPKPEAKPLATLKAPDDVQRMAILALVLALLSATTLIVWRHHRRDYASPRRIGRRI